MVKNVID